MGVCRGAGIKGGDGVCAVCDRVYIVSEMERGWLGMSGLDGWYKMGLDSGLDVVVLGSEKSVFMPLEAVKSGVVVVMGTGCEILGTGRVPVRHWFRLSLARAGVDVLAGLSRSDVASCLSWGLATAHAKNDSVFVTKWDGAT